MADFKVFEGTLGSRETEQVTTTLGDLIYAISEAATEASVEEKDIAAVTHAILRGMFREHNPLEN